MTRNPASNCSATRRFTIVRRIVAAGLLALAGLPSPAFADEAGARKYLDQAKKQVADKDQASVIQTTLQLAEAELANVDAAVKAPIAQEIAAIRTQLAGTDMEAFQQNTLRELERDFEAAQKLLGVRNAGIVKMLDDLDKKLNDSKVQSALGTKGLGEYRQKLSTFQSVNRTKLGEAAVEEMKRQFEFIEKQFPETMKELKEGSPLGKENTAASFERRYQEFLKTAKEAPQDNPTAAELTGRMDAMQKQVAAAFGTTQVVEVLDRRKRDWDSYTSGWQGWEAETTAPKFTDLILNQSSAHSRLGAPKTAELLNQAIRFQERLAESGQDKPYTNTSPLKEFVESIGKLRADAQAKLYGFADAIISEAEKTPLDLNGRNRLETFAQDDLRLSLPGHPQLAMLQERGLALVKKFDSATGADAQARRDAHKQMTDDAAARWPELVKSLSTVDNFDPSKPEAFQGKLLRFKNVSNRAGYDYGAEGDFDFAMAIDGKPLAGRFSPEVKQAIAEVRGKTGQGLPGETAYDVVAIYEGNKGVLQRRVQREGRVTVGGEQFDVRDEKKEPVDAPIVKIIGLHCGPVAVLGPEAGNVHTASVTSDVFSGDTIWLRLGDLLVMLLAAMCVLVKAQYAPLANIPQLGVVRENLTDRNQNAIGFVFLLLAAYRIIIGYVIYGLVGNLALAAAGLFLALGFFQGQSWFKPQWADQLRKVAVPIGMTCAAIGILRLLFGIAFIVV